jgi:nucleoid DNA-binding protein
MLTPKYTQEELKLAYQIVQTDLFNSLSSLKDNETIRLGNLGKFTKKEYKIKSALFKEKLGDRNTFIYYRISFKPFSKLKELLTNQIIKKYKLK